MANSDTGRGEKLVKAATEAIQEELIVLWDNLPHWQRDNQFIVRGYRKASASYMQCIASLSYIHNETVNIYTHLLASLAFVLLAPAFYNTVISSHNYRQASKEDIYVFACFFAGAIFCLGMSATYHTISNHSEAVNKFGNKLDYLGIILMIWGGFIPSIYYGFGCHPQWINTYWTMVCVSCPGNNVKLIERQITTMAAACAVVTCYSAFATPDWRPFRAGMFVALGLSAVLPIGHAMQLHSLSKLDELMGLRWAVLQGVLYILGAAIYAVR